MVTSPVISFAPTQQLAATQQLAVTPALVAYASLLALPGMELDRIVAHELEENPALIIDEARHRAMVAREAPPAAGSRPGGSMPETAAVVSWQESLIRDLRLELPAGDEDLAGLVVGCLDERGFLVDDPVATGATAGIDASRIERALRQLRQCGAPGTGARNARECLVLQLDRLASTDPGHQVARAIVARHLEDLAAGRLAAIAAAIGVDPEEVALARDYIRAHLRPGPDVEGGTSPAHASSSAWIRPDVAIIPLPDDPGRFDIEILESRRIIVTVDPALRDAARAARDPNLLCLVRRADFFLARLQERWTTLRRITAFVADRQRGYLRDGPSAHVPLTRASVAAGLGMHESTVSRATAGKYVRLPTHQTVAFDVFFDGSTGARSALRSILATEPRALSDAELGRRLELAGFAVARRTVTKYRERMGYLPSTRRSPAGPDAHGRRWANPASIPVNRDSART